MQYQLAGMVALTILLVEKLKHLHLSQNKSLFYIMLEYAITLLGSFTTNCTATVVQIADKCGLFKLLIDFLEQLGAFRVVRVHEPAPLQNKILNFFHTCLPLVSPRTMLLIFSCAKIAGDPEISQQLISSLVRTPLQKLNNHKVINFVLTLIDKAVATFETTCRAETLKTTILNAIYMLSIRRSLISASNMHNSPRICTGRLPLIQALALESARSGTIGYDLGFICMTCSRDKKDHEGRK
jgi:hypothetical protein